MMVQFMRFGVVGGIATAVQYLVLIMLVQWAGINPVISSAIGFTASAFLNYALNYRYTFRSGRSHRQALPRFFAVALSGLSLNTLLMALMVGVLGLNYMLAQLTATSAVLFGNFFANRHWTFKNPGLASGSDPAGT